MKILTARQARQIDEITCRELGIPNLLLMENAAARLVEYLEQFGDDLRGRQVLILTGKGNNGGDGLAAARQLLMRGALPHVCLLADPATLRGDALHNYRMAVASGVPMFEAFSDSAPASWPPEWKGYGLLLDAMLGTGTRGAAEGLFARAIQWVNQEFAGHVVAVDLPSGLEADSCQIPGPVVSADATVTFTAPKLCHLLHPAAECVGRLIVSPIGTPAEYLEREEYTIELFDRALLSPVLGLRPESSHKGQFGRILVLAGGRGKAGAAAMAGLGALKSGAGLVTVATPRGCQELVAAFAPELMTEGLGETSSGMFSAAAAEEALALGSSADVLAVGPGMGQERETSEFLRVVLEQTRLPVVLDADALNLLAAMRLESLKMEPRVMVLTPHPGEMARLMTKSTGEIQADRLGAAREHAIKNGVYVVLKGSRTVIASPAGRLMINVTGNPGMATGGSGDVLTGMVASLLAQQQLRSARALSDRETARAVATAVCWHGLAGDCAAATTGQLSLVATDILKLLPDALKLLLETETYWPGGSRRPFIDVQPKRSGESA